MYRIFLLIAVCAITLPAFSQNTLTVAVNESKSAHPLYGATVAFPELKKITSTNTQGKATISDIPNGRYLLEIRFVGHQTVRDSIFFPVDSNKLFVYNLAPAEGQELEEVVVSSTRSSRTIENIPTRVEVIAGEELDEKGNMKPGDIRMILNESTGIQTQQTSATSANASIRIQGLDGRYTQILKDGFPLFSGAASGLGLLQTPPLDLKQVEVIKGSASTLYGGGAIAGLVNLISKTPTNERKLDFHLNSTSAGGLDLNGFYAERFGKAGLTLFASRNSNKAYTPSGIDFTAIPEFTRYTLNPKLFLYFNDKTSLNFGINSSIEDRTGGDQKYIEGDGDATHSFFERNNSDRVSTQFAFKHKVTENSVLNLRNSLSYFNRKLTIPNYLFDGTQVGSFTEASYSTQGGKAEWVTGLNVSTDQFKENKLTEVPRRDYRQTTVGVFIQNNVHATDWLEIESGLRGDRVVDYGLVLLPRISALFKVSDKFNSRIGGGLGYKTPTIFTEESERIQFQNVLPISSLTNILEKSNGINWDVNYRTAFFSDRVSFSINNLLFYTFLKNPLTMVQDAGNQYRFTNLQGHMDSKGMETNVKLAYQDFKLFVGYTLTDAKIHANGVLRQNPLTAKHRLNNVLMYEVEEKWKIGGEAYYYSRQTLNDGAESRPYWIFGFMAEKIWEKFSLYINFENFTDTRQTRFDSIYSGTVTKPVFRDIYAPLDGFVVNGGLKLRL